MPRQSTPNGTGGSLAELLAKVRTCRVCRDRPIGPQLPHEPRPVLRADATATLCIAGQAPGTRVHATGVPFNDPSGDRLRQWMGIERPKFYDASRVAIVPMGFCFPGLSGAGADLPPRGECADTWHDAIFARLLALRLILAIGAFAQAYHLPGRAGANLTETVRNWREIAAATAAEDGRKIIPLPHSSWRNSGWLKKNRWFEAELLPALRAAIADAIG